MPTYLLRVGTQEGQIVEREIRADDMAAAREEARRQGLHVFKARQKGITFGRVLQSRRAPVSTQGFLLFNQELTALVRAGLPILQSFEVLLERQRSPRFKEILVDIHDKVKSGMALSDAFSSYGSVFPPIYATSLRAGERSGDLEGVLRRFLRYQKLIVALRKKVVGALVYPAVIVSAAVAMVIVMLTVVIPKFSEFYAGFGAELPPFTKFVIWVAFIVRSNLLGSVLTIAAIVFLVRRWAATEHGALMLDAIKIRIPVVGGVLRHFAILQFSQSLGTLLGGGTPMVPAIEIASQSITNRKIASRVVTVAQQVREGEPLWRSLESTGVMSDLAIEMVKVGESTGALVEMLSNVSEFYDEEIDAKLTRMVALIEPVILIVLGIVIAGMLYAFYLPLFRLTALQQG